MKEFFLPFERLDLSYGWKSIINAKRAHYFDTVGDKTIVVSGKGDFIFFETKNFFSEKVSKNMECPLWGENQSCSQRNSAHFGGFTSSWGPLFDSFVDF